MVVTQQKGAAIVGLLVLAALVIGGTSIVFFARKYAEKATEQKLGPGAKVNLPGEDSFNIENNAFKQAGGTEARMPDNFPSDVPLYPNGKLTNVSQLKVNGAPTALTFEYEGDMVDKISSHYKENLEKNGWVFNPTGVGQTSGVDVIFANKQNRELQMTVGYKDGKTLLMLSVKG